MRVEASDDREADSDLSAVGAGPSVVHSGAVAGFPLPPLRYFVGGGGPTAAGGAAPLLVSPGENETVSFSKPLTFIWGEVAGAVLYQFELAKADGEVILSALLPAGATSYLTPDWFKNVAGGGALRWRVTALDKGGSPTGPSSWRALRPHPFK